MRCNVWGRPHLQGEVQLLAKEHDEVCLSQNLCECAQRRVVRSAGAFHLDDRRAGSRGQVCEGGGTIAACHHRPRQYERRGCRSYFCENLQRIRVRHRTGCAPLEWSVDAPLMRCVYLAVDDVERQSDMNRARTSGRRDVERSANVVVEIDRTLCSP